jgi:plastocyanin
MRNTILRLAALWLVALLLFAPSAGAQGKTMTVSIKNFAFNPPNATVSAGTTVTWVNNDQGPHTATANDGTFDSGTLQPGQSYSFTFDKAGTYAYHCNIHPYMTATVTVSGASTSASPSANASSSPSASPTASASPSASPSGSASASASGSASASSSGSAMATSSTASAITSPTASASTQQLPSSGGSTLELVAGLALVAIAIALVSVLVRRGAAS